MVPETELPLYLDCAATTPVDERVLDAMLPWLRQHFGNPASGSHAWGWNAARAVDRARQQVAALIGADARDIVWTSGATEANNLALKGAALQARRQGRGQHLISLKTEHSAVLDTLAWLQGEGFELSLLDVQPDGLLDLQQLRDALRPDTVLVSAMLVNNETGVVQDIDGIGQLCRERGVLLHVDAAQASGKWPIDLARLPVDLMSLTAHKSHGPKGIGALYVRRAHEVQLLAQMHGGGQERGLRSGTLATHQIVGMGAAFELAAEQLTQDSDRAWRLHRRLLAGLQGLGGVRLNGHAEQRVPHILNLGFAGLAAEDLMLGLPELALSSGSACHSGSARPSHVLRAMGCSDEQAHGSLRISLGRQSTQDQIDWATGLIADQVQRLRELSPVSGV